MTASEAIQQLEDFGFRKATDFIGEYTKGAALYFLELDIEEYIVFHHRNPDKSEDLQALDCWLGTYKFTEFIGKVPAIELETIKRDFDFEKDWKLLAKYLNFD